MSDGAFDVPLEGDPDEPQEASAAQGGLPTEGTPGDRRGNLDDIFNIDRVRDFWRNRGKKGDGDDAVGASTAGAAEVAPPAPADVPSLDDVAQAYPAPRHGVGRQDPSHGDAVGDVGVGDPPVPYVGERPRTVHGYDVNWLRTLPLEDPRYPEPPDQSVKVQVEGGTELRSHVRGYRYGDFALLDRQVVNGEARPEDVQGGDFDDEGIRAGLIAVAAARPEVVATNIRDLENGDFVVEVTAPGAEPGTSMHRIDRTVPGFHVDVSDGATPADAFAAGPRGLDLPPGAPLWPHLVQKGLAAEFGGYQTLEDIDPVTASREAMERLTQEPAGTLLLATSDLSPADAALVAEHTEQGARPWDGDDGALYRLIHGPYEGARPPVAVTMRSFGPDTDAGLVELFDRLDLVDGKTYAVVDADNSWLNLRNPATADPDFSPALLSVADLRRAAVAAVVGDARGD